MTPEQPDQPDNIRPQPAPGADQQPLDAAPNSGREATVIPFPTPASGQVPRAPEVLEGELVSEPEYTRRPMPVVLPPWLGSRQTAQATARWAVEYAGRHVAFHVWRAPAYGLALSWWTLRGAARAIAAGFGWVS
ncbi:MAG: hypothetical protein WCF33_07235, partial [Pseudonocardiaceae bacterium]